MKQCRACGETKPLEEFHKVKETKGRKQLDCILCEREKRKRLYRLRENRSRKIYVKSRRHSLDGRAIALTTTAKSRARERNVSFNITSELVKHLMKSGKCAKSGIPFDLSGPKEGKYRNPFAPSIDRINADLGYEPFNIQIVCNMFNTGKNEHDEIDFVALCYLVAQNYKDQSAMIDRANLLMQMRANLLPFSPDNGT